MSDISKPENPDLHPSIKKSKNSVIQGRVGTISEILKARHPFSSEEAITQDSRNTVAKELRIGRLRSTRNKLQEEKDIATANSTIDALTGLPNNRGFEERLEVIKERMLRTGETAVAVIIDLNGLKETNDNEGHPAGDRLLKETAEALRRGSRLIDTVAFISRKGGDEFYIILEDTDREGSKKWWNRVRHEFTDRGVKVSAGAIELDPVNSENSILFADKAMYQAKTHKGGGKSHFVEAVYQEDGSLLFNEIKD